MAVQRGQAQRASINTTLLNISSETPYSRCQEIAGPTSAERRQHGAARRDAARRDAALRDAAQRGTALFRDSQIANKSSSISISRVPSRRQASTILFSRLSSRSFFPRRGGGDFSTEPELCSRSFLFLFLFFLFFTKGNVLVSAAKLRVHIAQTNTNLRSSRTH